VFSRLSLEPFLIQKSLCLSIASIALSTLVREMSVGDWDGFTNFSTRGVFHGVQCMLREFHDTFQQSDSESWDNRKTLFDRSREGLEQRKKGDHGREGSNQ